MALVMAAWSVLHQMILDEAGKTHQLLHVLGSLTLSSPTIGQLLVVTPEEVVIKPLEQRGMKPTVDARVHFPRIGFVVRPIDVAKL